MRRMSEPAQRRFVVTLTLLGLMLLQAFGGCTLNREGGISDQCSADSDCEDNNPCTLDSCGGDGACAREPIDAPLDQVSGDCQELLCLDGQVRAQPAEDPEDDGLVCTRDICIDGNTEHNAVAFNGDACEAPEGPGQCLNGACVVECQPGDDCDDDNDCTTDFCDGQSGVCAHDDLPDGPLSADVQEPGDCRLRICSAGMPSNVFDNQDLPVDDDPCTDDVCDNGVPMNPQRPTGSICSSSNDPLAQLCNADGACVECIGPTDCPGQDTECRTRTCSVAGSCGEVCATAGTPLNLQSPGDCTADVCDGMCGETTAPDATDVIVDGNDCTEDLCVNGSPVNPPTATGAMCGNAGVCNATGQCVGCNVAADCGNDTFCLQWSCDQSQTCQPSYTANDTPLPAAQQTLADCVELRCDGAGQVQQTAILDPIVDGNPCTDDLCVNGSPVNPASALDQSCMSTMYCDGNGSCVQCNHDGQCTSDDGVCEEDQCLSNSCTIVFDSTMDPGPNQTDGDCQTIFCDGMGDEEPLPTVDDGDLPVDGNECTQNQCTNGTPSNPPVAAETPCSGGVCNGDAAMPACVDCATDAQCAAGQTCDLTTWTCLQDPGQGCVTGNECLSGFCVDGVCCDDACTGTCFACDLSGAVGTCAAVPFNVDVDGECAGGACDGMGACKLSDGQSCSTGGQCLSDECVDAVCCDGPCAGTCEACNLSGSVGACTFVPFSVDVDGECAGGACDGAGACKLDLGQSCTMGSECLSAFCADGVCCDGACGGTCEACGAAGACTPHAVGTDPESECGSDVCNGSSACRCMDGATNGAESDIDCGGGTCPDCTAGQSCNGPSDCVSAVCTGGVCQAPMCGDGVVNGSEVCDFADPSTPCCATTCMGTAPSGAVCGADPDGTGCAAPPTCDGGGNGTGNCIAQLEPSGTGCTDDGVFCDGPEQCDAGGACLSSGNPCPGPDGDGNCSETCDESADSCTAPDPMGSACDDGLFCTGTDSCGATGACDQHTGDPCPGADSDGDCAESCDDATNTCTAADPVGSACDDGLFCTGADTCGATGLCDQHVGDPCLGADGDADCKESCDETGDVCTANDPVGSTCDDLLFCNGADTCGNGGQCNQHTGDPCPGPDSDADCNESCNEAMASCDLYDGDGAACDDGSGNMTCDAGTCSLP